MTEQEEIIMHIEIPDEETPPLLPLVQESDEEIPQWWKQTEELVKL